MELIPAQPFRSFQFMKRTKKINRALILREIWLSHVTSRIEVARTLELDKSTVSHAVNELIDAGMVVETREGSSGPQGGRRPKFITLNKEYGCILGVEITPELCSAVAVDLSGEIIGTWEDTIVIHDASFTELSVTCLERLIERVEAKGINLLGIGVGISGVVNGEKGIIMYSKPLGISDSFNFYEEVSSRFSVPVFIDNDANACVWGELAFHRRTEMRDFIFLLLEFRDHETVLEEECNRTAVGIGLVINGAVHYGPQFSAGEFRSVIRHKDSVGQFSLTSEEQERIYEPEIMKKFLTELFRHVALLVNTFNLSHIILGGAFEELGDDVKEILEKEIRDNWPYPYHYMVMENIWYSSMGKKAVSYGAAGMLLNTLFSEADVLEGVSRKRNLQGGITVLS